MSEIFGVNTSLLEGFWRTEVGHIFWLTDETGINGLLTKISSTAREKLPRFGVEIGFGVAPMRVDLINPNVHWILTEPDNEAFSMVARFESQDKLPGRMKHNILAVNSSVDKELVMKADIIAVRNPNYKWMAYDLLPTMGELEQGQRFFMVVNELYIVEIELYRDLLKRGGYDPDQLKPSSTKYTYPYPWNVEEYVFDYTKKDDKRLF